MDTSRPGPGDSAVPPFGKVSGPAAARLRGADGPENGRPLTSVVPARVRRRRIRVR